MQCCSQNKHDVFPKLPECVWTIQDATLYQCTSYVLSSWLSCIKGWAAPSWLPSLFLPPKRVCSFWILHDQLQKLRMPSLQLLKGKSPFTESLGIKMLVSSHCDLLSRDNCNTFHHMTVRKAQSGRLWLSMCTNCCSSAITFSEEMSKSVKAWGNHECWAHLSGPRAR